MLKEVETQNKSRTILGLLLGGIKMDNSETKIFGKAYELWDSFKNEVLYRNRFILNHQLLEYLKSFALRHQKILETGRILYRARIFTGDDLYLNYLDSDFNCEGLDVVEQLTMMRHKSDINSRRQDGFWGYMREDSFIPPNNDNVNEGRTNPAFIKYLYTAEDPYTALVEVRPYLKSQVSVAEIKVNESLNVADFSYESFNDLEDKFEKWLIFLIMDDLSKPVDSDKKRYIPTQYIAEYIKTIGFEGIRFNSSLHGAGRNITVFNYEKCQPVSSQLYQIEDICFDAKGIAPKYSKPLYHYKLDPFKEKQLKSFINQLKPIRVPEKANE